MEDNIDNQCKYFSYYQEIFSKKYELYDALIPSSDSIESQLVSSSSLDMQLKIARFIIYGVQESTIILDEPIEDIQENNTSSHFLAHTTLSFLQIVFFITLICLIKQYLNLRIVREEPIRLINKSKEYDAYDLVPDTSLSRKETSRHTKQNNKYLKDENNYQKTFLLNCNKNNNRNNLLFNERDTIMLLRQLNIASNMQQQQQKKQNTDKYVKNKRKCMSVGPVMLEVTKHDEDNLIITKHIDGENDEDIYKCSCEANWREAVILHHQNEAAILNHMCV